MLFFDVRGYGVLAFAGVNGSEYFESLLLWCLCGVCGAEEYFVDEAEEDGSGYSSGENIKVTRRKRNKRWHIWGTCLFV